jgi:hypothetical protein
MYEMKAWGSESYMPYFDGKGNNTSNTVGRTTCCTRHLNQAPGSMRHRMLMYLNQALGMPVG